MSSKQKLTASTIKNLPLPQGGRPNAVLFDTEQKGLGIRVSRGGTRSFFVNYYNSAGRERRKTIGEWPGITVTAARTRAAEIRANAKAGVDPLASDQARRQAGSVADLCSEYLQKWAKPNKKSWKYDERVLNTYVIPRWGRMKAQDVTGRDVVLLLDEIRERGAATMANRVLAIVRKMFNWACEQHILQNTPVTRIRATKEKSRKRFLSDEEIKQFWLAASQPQKHVSDALRTALKLVLLTGQRPGEVAAMRWQDIQDSWWSIEDTKNGETHRMYLSPAALELIEALRPGKEISRGRSYVFPAGRGNGHIASPALNRACNRIDWGMEHFTPHDLRRTMATNLGRLGFNRLIQDKVLNHKDNSVGGIYDRYSYDNEKQDAACRWADEVQRIVEGKASKITPIGERVA